MSKTYRTFLLGDLFTSTTLFWSYINWFYLQMLVKRKILLITVKDLTYILRFYLKIHPFVRNERWTDVILILLYSSIICFPFELYWESFCIPIRWYFMNLVVIETSLLLYFYKFHFSLSNTTLNLVHMYNSLSYISQLAQEGETVSANPRVSKVVTVLVVIDLCLSINFNAVIFSALKNNTL